MVGTVVANTGNTVVANTSNVVVGINTTNSAYISLISGFFEGAFNTYMFAYNMSNTAAANIAYQSALSQLQNRLIVANKLFNDLTSNGVIPSTPNT